MRNILIAFLAAFVVLAAVPAAAQTTGTATVGGVEKRAWNLLSGHVWTGADGSQYLNAGCQNIDPQPWGSLSSTVTLNVKIFMQLAGGGHGGSSPIFATRRGDLDLNNRAGQPCDLGKGIDIVTWKLPSLTWGAGWENLAELRIQIISSGNAAHLGVANNASQQWARLYFGPANPYPGTGVLNTAGRVVTLDELYDPGDYER